MLTVQILTKNNESTIKSCLESILPFNPQILIGDLDSQDETIGICERLGAKVVRFGNVPRDHARNKLMELATNEQHMYLEPWEVFAKGKLKNVYGEQYVSILKNQTLHKEVRLWRRGKFINPTYETLDITTDAESDVILYCIGSRDLSEDMKLVEVWKESNPMLPQPYYYQACIHFALQQYEQFYPVADHYLFLDNKSSMTNTMIRYYYALALLLHKRKVRPVLQNINLCLCDRPLMAEFWCLMADVYYHLLKKFDFAKTFYENAIFLGSKRLRTDKWPMDISKYGTYPKMMIDSCQKILETNSVYGKQVT